MEKQEQTDQTCPNCGMATAQLIICPRCTIPACVEFCIPGGVGTLCAKCEAEDE